jgi:hypothetical protein
MAAQQPAMLRNLSIVFKNLKNVNNLGTQGNIFECLEFFNAYLTKFKKPNFPH